MSISIVIPTDGRRHCLPPILEALLAQPLAEGDEVVVVDDAGAYNLREEIAVFLADGRITLLRHDWSKGLSAARNTGIFAAKNDVILLLADDTIPASGFIAGHRAARARHPGREVCILGRTEAHPVVQPSPFMRYASRAGWRQFSCCPLRAEEQQVPSTHVWGSNLSVDRSFLVEGGAFDEMFPGSDYDSQELAVRLAARGARLFYVPEIRAEARQAISIRSACKTEFATGRAFYYFGLKHPDAACHAAVPREAPAGVGTDGAARADLLKKIEALETSDSDEAERLYSSALALNFVAGFEHSSRENEGSQRLSWTGGEWLVLQPSKAGTLVRVQSTKGAERENEAILSRLSAVPDVLFTGTGNGSHIARYLSSVPEGRGCCLFEPHEFLYRYFRTRHDPRRVVRVASIEELFVHWPHRPLQPCILPALKALAAWPYAAVAGMLGARQHVGARGPARPVRRAMVLGPIAGRASAISVHVKQAFDRLGIETHFLDNSGHSARFAALTEDSGPVTAQQLNAAWEAAEEANIRAVLDARPDLVFIFPRAPLSPRALGMMKASGITTAFWLTEDHRSCREWEGVFRHVEWFFTVQNGGFLEHLRAQQANAHFLPLGAPASAPTPLRRNQGEVSFVGTAYPNRVRLFAALAEQRLPLSLNGVGWGFANEPRVAPFVRKSGFIAPPEVGTIYASSGISLNVHSSSSGDTMPGERDYLNARTFEIPGSGGVQLVDQRDELARYYEPGREILTYESAEELADKVRYYLGHSTEAEKVAENGFRATETRHLYRHRIEHALALINRG
jgi:spore maturation protein CgeB